MVNPETCGFSRDKVDDEYQLHPVYSCYHPSRLTRPDGIVLFFEFCNLEECPLWEHHLKNRRDDVSRKK